MNWGAFWASFFGGMVGGGTAFLAVMAMTIVWAMWDDGTIQDWFSKRLGGNGP